MINLPTQPSIAKPFAESGDKNAVPTASSADAMNLTDGFPVVFSKRISEQGKFVERKDMNGILNLISSVCHFILSGGLIRWNSTMKSGITGYPLGAKLWFQTDANTDKQETLIESQAQNNQVEPSTNTIDKDYTYGGQTKVWWKTVLRKTDSTLTATSLNPVRSSAVKAAIDAVDSSAVHKTGDEDIEGTKRFLTALKAPSVRSSGYQFVATISDVAVMITEWWSSLCSDTATTVSKMWTFLKGITVSYSGPRVLIKDTAEDNDSTTQASATSSQVHFLDKNGKLQGLMGSWHAANSDSRALQIVLRNGAQGDANATIGSVNLRSTDGNTKSKVELNGDVIYATRNTALGDASDNTEIPTTSWVRTRIGNWWDQVKAAQNTISGAWTSSGGWSFKANPYVVHATPAYVLKDTTADITATESAEQNTSVVSYDKNGKTIGRIGFDTKDGGALVRLAVYKRNGDYLGRLAIKRDASEGLSTECPHPDSSSNNMNIATTKWVRDLWTAIKTGAETITGNWTVSGILTVANAIVSNAALALKRNNNTSYVELDGGTAYNDGAYIKLCGSNREDDTAQKGTFQLTTGKDGTQGAQNNLIGKPNGSLSWGGNEVVRSVNGVSATANTGNVPLPMFVDVTNRSSEITINNDNYSTTTVTMSYDGRIDFNIDVGQAQYIIQAKSGNTWKAVYSAHPIEGISFGGQHYSTTAKSGTVFRVANGEPGQTLPTIHVYTFPLIA